MLQRNQRVRGPEGSMLTGSSFIIRSYHKLVMVGRMSIKSRSIDIHSDQDILQQELPHFHRIG